MSPSLSSPVAAVRKLGSINPTRWSSAVVCSIYISTYLRIYISTYLRGLCSELLVDNYSGPAAAKLLNFNQNIVTDHRTTNTR